MKKKQIKKKKKADNLVVSASFGEVIGFSMTGLSANKIEPSQGSKSGKNKGDNSQKSSKI